ncbi:MAG: recombinase family protein, partial [Gemmatimonadota bacterium]
GRHHERLAVVYVRQSTMQQVQHHQESTQVQYGLVDLANRLGWPRERILVVDDDLGVSGASVEGRLGFQRLLSEVALDHVGLILGVEMSRLARSCKDWYHLLELCALFATLICDLDGLYDPASYNDRLLLGLKGTMSEAELHILQMRMRQGALHKARRGELVSKVPIGYVRDAIGQVIMDPDEQAQSVVHLVFELFNRYGTVAAVLRYMVNNEIQLPVRVDHGPDKGQLQWRRPHRGTLRNMLDHPMYAGAYVHGRTRCKKTPEGRRSRLRKSDPDQWTVLLRDRYPAYISWVQYEQHRAQLAENRSRHDARGAVRRGRALLTGMMVCGRCGARMMTRYAGKASRPSYFCTASHTNYGAPRCQRLAAKALDDEVVRLALMAMKPSALEISLQVAADLETRRDELEKQWRQRLERANYEADRAKRQYDTVEPENRLVARTLEDVWEEKLRAHRGLVEQHKRFQCEHPQLLTPVEQDQIRRLASDLPALWNASSTTDVDRKNVLRQLIDRVEVNVEGNTEWVEARIQWAGGEQTYTRFRRPVARMEQLSTWPHLRDRIARLKREGCRAPVIAEALNRDGLRTPSGTPFTADCVRMWLSRLGLTTIRRSRANDAPRLRSDEWLVPDLAQELDISYGTIYTWIGAGRIAARQVDGPQSRWVVRVNDEQRRELTAYKRRRDGPDHVQTPKEAADHPPVKV